MPLGLGIASSHAPSMFAPLEQWPDIYRILAGDVPPPPELAAETTEVLVSYVDRVIKGFTALRRQVEARPDAIVIVGDDQNEVFGPAFNASLAIFLGAEVSGTPTSASWVSPSTRTTYTWPAIRMSPGACWTAWCSAASTWPGCMS